MTGRSAQPRPAAIAAAGAALAAMLLVAGCGDSPRPDRAGSEAMKQIRSLVGGQMDERYHATVALGKLRDPSTVAPLIEALEDTDVRVRVGAADALGDIGDSRAIGPLTASLKADDLKLRKAAALALQKIGDPSAIDALVAALGDPEVSVRMAVASAVAAFGDRVVPRLVEMLPATNVATGHGIVMALTKTGNKRAADALALLANHEDLDLRLAATSGLAQLGDERAAGPLSGILLAPLTPADRKKFDEMRKELPESRRREIEGILKLQGAPGALAGVSIYPHAQDKRKQRLTEEVDYIRKLVAEPLSDDARKELEEMLAEVMGQDRWDALAPDRRKAAIEYEAGRLGQVVRESTPADQRDEVIKFLLLRSGIAWWRGLTPQQRETEITAYHAKPIDFEMAASEQRVRRQAATALIGMKSAGAAAALLRVLPQANATVQAIVLEALRDIGEPAVPELIAFATGATNAPYTRTQAIELLVGATDPVRVDVLLALARDTSPVIARAAVSALSNVDDPRVVTPMLARLDDPDQSIRMSAGRCMEHATNKVIVPQLLKALERPDAPQESIARALGRLDARDAVEPLIRLIGEQRGSGRPNQKKAVFAEVLGLLGDRRATEPLLPLLNAPEPVLRAAAARALGLLRDPKAFEPLREAALTQSEWEVSAAAAVALGEYKDPRAVEVLTDMLSQGFYIRQEKRNMEGATNRLWRDTGRAMSDTVPGVLRALANIPGEESSRALLHTVAGGNEQQVRTAAQELVARGEQVVPILIQALDHTNANVRGVSAQLLARIGTPAIPAVLNVLKNGTTQAKSMAIFTVGEERVPAAVEPLIGLLTHADADIRAAAAWALGMIGEGRVKPALEAASKDKDPKVRDSVQCALFKVDGGDVPATKSKKRGKP